MTDLRSRISGVVLNRLADYGIRIDREVADSVADAMLSIPGTATVELPEPISNFWTVVCSGEPEQIYLASQPQKWGGERVVVISGNGSFYLDEAPRIAAALLAAHASEVGQ